MFLKICVLFFLGLSACGSKSHWHQRFQDTLKLNPPATNIVPANDNLFSFSMVGDLHVAGHDTKRLNQIITQSKNLGDDFLVLLGDLVDQGDADSFLAITEALTDLSWNNKVLPLLGNHDVFKNGWTEYKKIWGASHYTKDIGNSRFIALDSADGIIGEEQFDWLEKELKNNHQKNIFVLTHYMPVVPGQRTYLRLSNQLEAERLMKLVTRYQVKGVFGGHYHSFCREKIDGVEYVVAGGGGGRRMDPVKENFFVRVVIENQNVSFELKTLQ